MVLILAAKFGLFQKLLKTERINKKKDIILLDILKEEKTSKYSGEIYHKTQINLTYNSNHMESSRLNHEQTRYIFETNTVSLENEIINVEDIIDFHFEFESIHLFQDGNRRIGRLIMFKK